MLGVDSGVKGHMFKAEAQIILKLLPGPVESSERGAFAPTMLFRTVSWASSRKEKGCVGVNHFSVPACPSVGILMERQAATKALTQIPDSPLG